MAAQRQPRPSPQRPQPPALRLVQTGQVSDAPLAVGPSFHKGLAWGVVVSVMGFWAPVATAMYLWWK